MVMAWICSRNIENVKLSIKLGNFAMEYNFLFAVKGLKVNGKLLSEMENVLMMKIVVIVQLIFKKQDGSKEIALNFYVSKVLIAKFLYSYEITMNILFLLHFHLHCF